MASTSLHGDAHDHNGSLGDAHGVNCSIFRSATTRAKRETRRRTHKSLKRIGAIDGRKCKHAQIGSLQRLGQQSGFPMDITSWTWSRAVPILLSWKIGPTAQHVMLEAHQMDPMPTPGDPPVKCCANLLAWIPHSQKKGKDLLAYFVFLRALPGLLFFCDGMQRRYTLGGCAHMPHDPQHDSVQHTEENLLAYFVIFLLFFCGGMQRRYTL
ncbi:uncharacterized protein LOC119359407 [Triticum dicoccoides]|uniref:uncharacterized protein LOC119359407 n=1 Tax=Triticum dicoccoides TaxID=85692 RepID=UPI000E7CFCF9|nr:uncharacterized protein LOC119359407 [Triticum dicoccoides]